MSVPSTLSKSMSSSLLSNEFKSRNILSLEQRVKVIQHYDHTKRSGCACSLQSLAEKFSCSSKQIKNILRNKANIINLYQSCIPTELHKDDVQQKRRDDKIRFLCKVMYEYVERVVYHRIPIDMAKVCWKATEVKECIAIENFIVNQAWLSNFQKLYGLRSFDLETLCNNVMIHEPKRTQLNAIDLIQFVTKKDQQQQDIKKMLAASSQNCNHQSFNKRPALKEKSKSKNYSSEIGNTSLVTTADKLNNNLDITESRDFYTLSNLPDIKSVNQALLHIKALEEFAMLRDNFRAIGLLTQLEIMFKKEV